LGPRKPKGLNRIGKISLGLQAPMPKGGESDKTLFVYVFVVGKIKTLDHSGLKLV
jgi:hypothetical protein